MTDERDERHAARDRMFETAHLRRNLGRRSAIGGVATLGGQGGRFVVEGVRIVLLARLLEPADYGLVAMVTVVTGFLGLFQDFGLTIATITREEINHRQVSTLFWVNVGFSVGLTVITILVAPLLATFYQEPRVSLVALSLAPNFLLGGLAVQHQALLRRQMRFISLAGAQLAAQIAGLVVGFAMAWAEFGYWSLIGVYLGTSVANLVILWTLSGWVPGLPSRGVGVRSMLRIGANVMGTNILTWVRRGLEHMLLGRTAGVEALGIYTKAQSLVETPIARALGPFGSVVVPSLSRLTGQPDRYRRAYLRVLEKLVLVALPGAVFMAGTAERLIPFALGDQWIKAGPIFGVLALRGLISPVMRSTWWLFVTQDRTDEALRWTTAETLGMIVAILAGLPYGGFGVAVGITAMTFLLAPLVGVWATQNGPVGFGDLLRTLRAPAIAAAAALYALSALAPRVAAWPDAQALAAAFALDGAVFGLVLCMFPMGRAAIRDVAVSLASLVEKRRSK